LGEAVGEMKGHMLGDLGTLKVGKVAAAVPPGSAILQNGVFHAPNREIHPANPAGWGRGGVPDDGVPVLRVVHFGLPAWRGFTCAGAWVSC